MTPTIAGLHWTGRAVCSADVLVVGAGPSGVCAAIAAARSGADTVLVERAGFLGGTATGGMVAAFNGFYWHDIRVTGGIAADIVVGLERNGGTRGFQSYTAGALTDHPLRFQVLPFDPEILKFVLDDLTREAGVNVVHHAQAAAALMDGSRATGVVFAGPSGLFRVDGKLIVDATGSGIVARSAGATVLPQQRGRHPMTLMMRVSGVDRREVEELPRELKRQIVLDGVSSQHLFYRTLAMSWSPTNGDAFLLMTAVEGFDGLDPLSLSAAEIEGRRQARETLSHLRAHMPGFRRAALSQLAPWIGVRETCRIHGQVILRAADVLAGQDSPATVSYGAGPVDRHEGDSVLLAAPAAPFAVPYGCLVPVGPSNMLVTGRTVSAEAGAMDGLRHMGGVMPLGHAAGVAAALAAHDAVPPSELDPDVLRAALRDQGAIVDRPAMPTPSRAQPA